MLTKKEWRKKRIENQKKADAQESTAYMDLASRIVQVHTQSYKQSYKMDKINDDTLKGLITIKLTDFEVIQLLSGIVDLDNNGLSDEFHSMLQQGLAPKLIKGLQELINSCHNELLKMTPKRV